MQTFIRGVSGFSAFFNHRASNLAFKNFTPKIARVSTTIAFTEKINRLFLFQALAFITNHFFIFQEFNQNKYKKQQQQQQQQQQQTTATTTVGGKTIRRALIFKISIK